MSRHHQINVQKGCSLNNSVCEGLFECTEPRKLDGYLFSFRVGSVVRSDSSLSVEQRVAAVAAFEAGYGSRAAARRLGLPVRPVNSLYDRWVLHGKMALVARDRKSVYSWEFKRSIVARFLAGESARQLAAEFNFSSSDLVYSWVRVWRLAGDEGLRPKKRGRKPKTLIASLDQEGGARVVDAALIEENTRLKAQVAYLKKLRDLRDQGQG